MTDSLDPTPERDPVRPDPAKYDSPRAEIARAKGLDTPYIPGGEDPEPEKARREERFLGRLLVIMIVVIVSAGFILGLVTTVLSSGVQ